MATALCYSMPKMTKLVTSDDKFEQKLDNLPKDVNDLKTGQTKLETEFTSLKEDVKELKSSQKA
jgi:exonuclease VII small subunit